MGVPSKSLLGALAVAGLMWLPSTAAALPMCGNGVDVTTYNAGGGCTVDDLTFSDFSVVNAGQDPNPLVDAVKSYVLNGVAYFELNPNLATVGVMQDIHFFFKVTGLIDGVDLTNAGIGDTSIGETVCGSAFTMMNTCLGGPITSLLAGSGGSDSKSFSERSTTYIYKDIFKGPEGHLTSFTQSFHTPAVPEPASLLLLGSGLIGLASRSSKWLKRRS